MKSLFRFVGRILSASTGLDSAQNFVRTTGIKTEAIESGVEKVLSVGAWFGLAPPNRGIQKTAAKGWAQLLVPGQK